MTRFARTRSTVFVEEPVLDLGAGDVPEMETRTRDGVIVATPHLQAGLEPERALHAEQALVDALLRTMQIERPVLWYYTPMALKISRDLPASAVVYDCMDELAAFKFAPPELPDLERELFKRADLVFTGGQSLYEAKQAQHSSVHLFPSSIDAAHFGRARELARENAAEPEDQRHFGRPRLGFFGVIDERMDIDLLDAIAATRPDWHIVMIGPVVKIEPSALPQRPNIHYLGARAYADLPRYLAGWDVALIPFASNESTRYISPTKTPEYLAAGKPVVSTPIHDVVRAYGQGELVHIGGTPAEFIAAVEAALRITGQSERYRAWLQRVDAHLAQMSWNKTWAAMNDLIERVSRQAPRPAQPAQGAPDMFEVAGARS